MQPLCKVEVASRRILISNVIVARCLTTIKRCKQKLPLPQPVWRTSVGKCSRRVLLTPWNLYPPAARRFSANILCGALAKKCNVVCNSIECNIYVILSSASFSHHLTLAEPFHHSREPEAIIAARTEILFAKLRLLKALSCRFLRPSRHMHAALSEMQFLKCITHDDRAPACDFLLSQRHTETSRCV